MYRRVRILAVFLTVVVLATGAVRAMPALTRSAGVSESEGVLARIWGWLSALFLAESSTADDGRRAAWEEDGSHGDPNGEH